MANHAEDHKVLPADHRRRTEAIPEHRDNESNENLSDEEEFPPEEVDDSYPDSRFVERGAYEPRQISAHTANLQPSSSNTHNNQNQSYGQNSVSQKKTPHTPRQVDPKRYPKGT
ncbi:hypothetical protein M405DRAFT_832839 [Rhizopogon salebrosus TDB-379]|nr:hypothetical protein M405DRAFT_832839 [Rhizopogon salebrosus TDB-379]